MNTIIIIATGVSLAVILVLLGVLNYLPVQVAGMLAATIIGVLSLILATEARQTRYKENVKCEGSEAQVEEGLLWKESILVRKDGCSYYEFIMHKKEKIIGEIDSSSYFDVYLLTPRNYSKYNDGEPFRYEYGTQRASKMTVNFIPKRLGKYYCVIKNGSDNDIEVNVSLQVRKK